MESLNPLPKAISHKELGSLLKNAQKCNKDSIIINDENLIKAEKFKESLKLWVEQSEELLNILNRKENFILEGRTPKSLMALGAMESHLNISLQALKASENN